MRQAAVRDAWAAIRKAPSRSTAVDTISFQGVSGIADASITIRSPLTAICGINGVGKSFLLRALWSALDPEAAIQRHDIISRAAEATITVALSANGLKIARVIENGKPNSPDSIPDNIQISYVDSSASCLDIQIFFRGISSIDEAINGVDAVELEGWELSFASYITGKNYTDIQIFELEAFEPLRPYFVATCDGVTYDINAMSTGEISSLYLIWTMRRAKKNALILIDEPETFVSPNAQTALMNFFAHISNTKKISFLIATHSPALISQLEPKDMIMMYATQAGSKFAPETQYGTLLEKIGLTRRSEIVAFVEDRLARDFLNFIIRHKAPDLMKSVSAVDIGGKDKIESAIKLIPQWNLPFKIIGIFDSDQKGAEIAGNTNWPFDYLPGGPDGFEIELRNLSQSAAVEVAAYLSLERDAFDVANSSLQGTDPHDWPYELGRALSIDYSEILNALFKAWVEVQANQAAAEDFINRFRASCGK